jgi:hypothetical protein
MTMNTTSSHHTTETITMEQIATGDRISVNGPDERMSFVVTSVRDGMQNGRGFRTDEGEYLKLPWGYTVTRFNQSKGA